MRHGDVIRILPPEPTHPPPVAEDIPLDILYEDEFLAVVNKPADMVVHPAKGHWSGTLVNALRFHFDQLSEVNGDYRAGIVHRLDRDTSGVILIAKEEQTHRDLSLHVRAAQDLQGIRRASRPACSTATAITSRAASATIRTTASR